MRVVPWGIVKESEQEKGVIRDSSLLPCPALALRRHHVSSCKLMLEARRCCRNDTLRLDIRNSPHICDDVSKFGSASTNTSMTFVQVYVFRWPVRWWPSRSGASVELTEDLSTGSSPGDDGTANCPSRPCSLEYSRRTWCWDCLVGMRVAVRNGGGSEKNVHRAHACLLKAAEAAFKKRWTVRPSWLTRDVTRTIALSPDCGL